MTTASTALDRPRLVRRLDARTPVTVVWGPAGYGKTSLVEAWLAGRPDLVAARVAAPGGAVTSDAHWRSVARVSSSLVGTDSVLVLDLSVGVDPEHARARLADLRREHPGLQIVVRARRGGFFSGTWLSASDVTMITPADLEFTEDELARLLADRGCVVSARTVRDIWRITGGHPALVRTAEVVVRLFGRELELERERAYAAIEAQVDRYVRTGLFPGDAPAGLCEAACVTARLRRLTVEAVAALGVPDPETVIATLERAGLLQRMPSEPGRYWVFPHAVRRALVRFAARVNVAPPPESVAALARRLADTGDPVEALRHATDSRDWRLVLEILAASWLEVATTRVGVLTRAVTALPETVVGSHAALHYARELVRSLASGGLGGIRPRTDGFPSLESIAARDSVELALVTGSLRSTLMRWIGDYHEAVREEGLLTELAARLSAGPAAGPGARGLAVMWMHLGLARQYRGDHGAAAVLFIRAVETGAGGTDDYAARQSSGQLALLSAVLGEHTRVEYWMDRESEFGDRAGWLGAMIGLPATTARALVQLDRLDVSGAEATLMDVPALHHHVENWAFVVYVRCQLDLIRGRPEVGLDRLARERSAFRKWLTPGSFARPLLQAAAMDLRTAAGSAADVFADVRDIETDLHPLVGLSAARAALLAGHAEAALEYGRTLADRGNPYTRVRLEALLVTAVAALDTGDRALADVAWTRAVALSEASGVVRPFATVPAPTRDVLAEAGTEAPQAWRALDWRGGPFPAPLVAVRLTEREIAVLGGLARGDSVARIAAAQFVSQNTVKSQLGSLYRKLGVHSRREAVDTARRRGLL